MRSTLRSHVRNAVHTGRAITGIARSGSGEFVRLYPPGHFYSPIPSAEDVRRGLSTSAPESIAAIDLRDEAQRTLLDRFAELYSDQPFDRPGGRYSFENEYFLYGDALVLFGIMRLNQPKRIVEVGSGFSSAAMMDVDERFLGRKTSLTFIEPYPDRLNALLRSDDSGRMRLIAEPVQSVDAEVFRTLEANDILFIDSSHVSKIGSDVNYLVFEILPSLRSGVIVHFHDIFWPFEYPAEWVEQGRAWNEAYLVRAFLQYNGAFEILYFNSYMAAVHPERVAEAMPLAMKNPGASLWLRKK